jgi:hypothetical protein
LSQEREEVSNNIPGASSVIKYSWKCHQEAIILMISSEHAVADLPRPGRPRKLTDGNAMWIGRKVQKNPFVTRGEIKSDLDEVGLM